MIKVLLLFFSICAFPGIWEAQNSWDLNWEKKYQNWIQNEFSQDIFSNPNSPYYGIKTDCADAIYAARAIFSMENSLPFQFKNTTGGKPKFFTNQYKGYDKLASKQERLISFLNFFGDLFSTYSLAFNDTLPVKPNLLGPGDIFVAPTHQNDNGFQYRHSHIIKDISTRRYFHLMSSTVPSEVRTLKLIKGLPKALIKKTQGWGFKRFIWPKDYNQPITKINLAKENLSFPRDRGFSFDQSGFIFNKNFINIFMDHMYKGRVAEKEELESFIDRKLFNICQLLSSRKTEVDKSISRINSKNTVYLDKNQCLRKEHYGSYSTPSRDAAIYDEVISLYSHWDKSSEQEKSQFSNRSYDTLVKALKYSDYNQNPGRVNINAFDVNVESFAFIQGDEYTDPICELNISGKPYYISDFINRYTHNIIQRNQDGKKVKARNLSDNPNDSLLARWGLSTKRRSCTNYDEVLEFLE